jgi:hypothetical protein
MPVANAGALIPTTLNPTSARSADVRRRDAATTPNGTPTTNANTNASPANSSERPSRRRTTVVTGSFERIDRPKSNRAAPSTHATYCSMKGRSR